MTGLDRKFRTYCIEDLVQMQESGRLNLSPGFQRQSVWGPKDRRLLIESIFDGMPLPSIFLYKRTHNGRPIYDVLDGKQRLESIFMFMGIKPFRRERFDIRYHFDDADGPYWFDWADIRKWDREGEFRAYELPAVEVEADSIDEVIKLFVRINSTGQKLTRQERRHAQFMKTSQLLTQAQKLATRFGARLQEAGVVSASQRKRMRDVEIVAELLSALLAGQPQHKKAALDRAMTNGSLTSRQLDSSAAAFSTNFHAIQRILPDIRAQRFHRVSDFYSLFLVVHDIHQAGLSTKSSKNCQRAGSILRRFGAKLDELSERQRSLKVMRGADSTLATYLMSTREGADSLKNRRTRATILADLLEGVFETKDSKRRFNEAQRRLIWNSRSKPLCAGCEQELTWDNYHADHIRPHSRGGRTSLDNAQALCSRCNTSKSDRVPRVVSRRGGGHSRGRV